MSHNISIRGRTYEEIDSIVEKLSEDLENGKGAKLALQTIIDVDAPLAILKSHRIKDLLSGYLDNPETSSLAKQLKHHIKHLKKNKKKQDTQQNLGVAPKMEQHNLDNWMDDDSETEISQASPSETPVENEKIVVKFAGKLTGRLDVESSKKKHEHHHKSEKDRKRSKTDDVDTSTKKCPPVKIKMVEMFADETPKKKHKSSKEKRSVKEEFSSSSSLAPSSSYSSSKGSTSQAVSKILSSHVEPKRTVKFEKQEPKEKKIIPFNEEDMFRPRKDSRKVFAGRKKEVLRTEVLSLVSLSKTVLTQNPMLLMQHVNWMPIELIGPALKQCSPEQLKCFMAMNPAFSAEADEFFEPIIEREFPGKTKEPHGFDTLRDLYFYLVRTKKKEDKTKLDRLRTKITDRAKTADTGRRTQLIAEAHTPKLIRQRQALNGLAHSMKPTPTAHALSQARKAVGEGNKAKLAAMPSAVVNKNSRVGASTGVKKFKTAADLKTGYLMKKTMKMLNIKRK